MIRVNYAKKQAELPIHHRYELTTKVIFPKPVLEDDIVPGNIYRQEHENGWTIIASFTADYYVFVDEFIATHSDGTFVRGNFNKIVRASSHETLKEFLACFELKTFDRQDI